MPKLIQHRDYGALEGRMTYAWDVYTGEYADPGRVSRYLVQRKQGEADPAFAERKALADPAQDFASVVDSLSGMLFAAEEKTARRWAEEGSVAGFGDPEDRASTARRILTSIDGRGTNLETMLKRAAVRLGVMHRVFGLVDGALVEGERRTKEVTGHIVDARDVVNWREEGGRLVEALVRDALDQRASIFDAFDEAEYYTLYTLEGWQRLKKDGDVLMQTGDGAEYAYFTDSTRSARMLPLFMVEMPLPRPVGYLLARKCVSLFNTESELDNLLRLACMPRFGVDTGESGVVDFEQIRADIAAGYAIIEGAGHQYIAPPSEPAAVRMERLRQKRQDFYAAGFREYGDAAKEATATERRQDWAAGVEAYLTLLSGALEEFEIEMMRRFEGAEFPEHPEAWGIYEVRRSRDFQPENIRSVMGELVRSVFGADPLPAPAEAAADVAARYLAAHGVDVDPEQVAAEVRRWMDRREQSSDAVGGLF